MQNIFARGFYAARDTLTPAIVGTVLTFLNLPRLLAAGAPHQHLGLALASSLGIMLYTVVLFVLLGRRTENPGTAGLVCVLPQDDRRLGARRRCRASPRRWLEAHLGWQTTPHAFVVLVIVSTVGFLLTTILAKLLRVREIDHYLNRLVGLAC